MDRCGSSVTVCYADLRRRCRPAGAGQCWIAADPAAVRPGRVRSIRGQHTFGTRVTGYRLSSAPDFVPARRRREPRRRPPREGRGGQRGSRRAYRRVSLVSAASRIAPRPGA